MKYMVVTKSKILFPLTTTNIIDPINIGIFNKQDMNPTVPYKWSELNAEWWNN